MPAGLRRHEQLVRLVRPVERGALGGRKGLAASFAAVALLFLAVDHDVSFSRSCVGPAASVVAKLFVRVHWRLLLLTSDTSKGAAGPAFRATHPSSAVAWGATTVQWFTKYVLLPWWRQTRKPYYPHAEGPGTVKVAVDRADDYHPP